MPRLLATPGKLGNLEIKNRMVMAAMGDLIANPDSTVSDAAIAYYGARAKGGVGLVITGIVRINDADGAAGPNQLSLADDRYIPGFRKLVDEVHRHGAKIFPQIQHSGRQGVAAYTGTDHVVAPSAIPSAVTRQPTKELTVEEIHTLVGQFGDAARRAKEAGADGVEIHGAHGYLINQFLSSFSNKRTDDYGGSFDNRMRFLLEIMRDVRGKCGAGFPITVRLSVDEFLLAVGISEPGIDIAEGVKIARRVEEEGVEGINVSCGTYESMNLAIEPVSFPQGWRRDFITAVKKAVSVPVIAVAKFREPAVAEAFLQEGVMDFAAFGRPLLADPEFCIKAAEGRDDEINHCISCLFCFEELNSGSHVVCAVNPRTGFESKFPCREKVAQPKTVAVVGAGPAGIAAALELAKNGHKPVVFEATDSIGGQVRIGKNPPKKDDLGWFIEDSKKKIADLGIEVKLNCAADAAAVKALSPDAVIVACGALPIQPKVPGADLPHVYSVEDVLSGRAALQNKTVAVIGSGLTGLEVAEYLQANGCITPIVEMQETIAPGAYVQNVMDVRSRLKPEATEMLTSHRLTAIEQGCINMEKAGGEQVTREVDAVVLSVGYRPDQALIDSFAGAAPKVAVVGDAREPKNIGEAVRAGFQAAYKM